MAWRAHAPTLAARVATWILRPLRLLGRVLSGRIAWHVAHGANGTVLITENCTNQICVLETPGINASGYQWHGFRPVRHIETTGNNLWGIAVASLGAGCHEGEVAVTQHGGHKVQVLDQKGNVLREWGQKGHQNGDLCYPQGVAITDGPGPSGAVEVLVTERANHRVQVFRLADGAFLRTWGCKGRAAGQFDDPADVCVTKAGEVIVSDFYNHRIQVFRLDGTFLRQWGKLGGMPEELACPWGVALLGDDVLVADEGNRRVQRFRLDGVVLGSLKVSFRPRGLAVMSKAAQVCVARPIAAVLYVSQ